MWQPEQYAKYSNFRLRPALDLIAAIPNELNPQTVVDLGSGPGNITQILVDRYPDAKVIGLDNSQEMLAKARSSFPHIDFIEGNIAELTGGFDLVFSNAAVHWVKNHYLLIPRLLQALNPSGVLAVQIPANFDAPSHRVLREIINSNRDWQSKLKDSILYYDFLQPADYYQLFSDYGYQVDLWTTTYFQALSGKNAVVEWVKGSVVSDLRASLLPTEVDEILTKYSLQVAKYYPENSNGTTLFPFTRLFFVAKKK